MTSAGPAIAGSAYDMLRRLYPALPSDPAEARASRRASHQVLAVPSLEDARMFLPAQPRLAAAALRGARRDVDLRGRLTTSAAATGLRAGVGAALRSRLDLPVSEDCVETALQGVVDTEMAVAVFLGPPRANRKPVIQVLSSDGRLHAVAKAGLNPLTAGLAVREAEALRVLGGCRLVGLRVPALLSVQEQSGYTMVVQSALEVPRRSQAPEGQVLQRVVGEIAGCRGVTRSTLAGSAYLADLLSRVELISDDDLRGRVLAALRPLQRSEESVAFGAWHGDFSPWNVAMSGPRALVWDWERFTEGVPVGYDALHFAFLPRLKDRRAPEELAGVELLDRAATLLQGLGVDPVQAPTVALLYLVEIGTRFTLDGQAGTGIRGGAAQRWLLPALVGHGGAAEQRKEA